MITRHCSGMNAAQKNIYKRLRDQVKYNYIEFEILSGSDKLINILSSVLSISKRLFLGIFCSFKTIKVPSRYRTLIVNEHSGHMEYFALGLYNFTGDKSSIGVLCFGNKFKVLSALDSCIAVPKAFLFQYVLSSLSFTLTEAELGFKKDKIFFFLQIFSLVLSIKSEYAFITKHINLNNVEAVIFTSDTNLSQSLLCVHARLAGINTFAYEHGVPGVHDLCYPINSKNLLVWSKTWSQRLISKAKVDGKVFVVGNLKYYPYDKYKVSQYCPPTFDYFEEIVFFSPTHTLSLEYSYSQLERDFKNAISPFLDKRISVKIYPWYGSEEVNYYSKWLSDCGLSVADDTFHFSNTQLGNLIQKKCFFIGVGCSSAILDVFYQGGYCVVYEAGTNPDLTSYLPIYNKLYCGLEDKYFHLVSQLRTSSGFFRYVAAFNQARDSLFDIDYTSLEDVIKNA